MNYNNNLEKSKYYKYEKLKSFLKVFLICAVSTLLSIIMNDLGIGKENTLMVFIVGVLTVTTVTRGYIYSAVAAVLSVILFNYFFTEPIHSLQIINTQDYILIVFFLIASLISSTMTSKLQNQTEISKRNERTAQLLYDITKGFLNVTGKENIILKGINYIKDYVGYDCYVKLDYDEKVFCVEGMPNYDNTVKENVRLIPIKGVKKKIGVMELIDAKSSLSVENEMIIKAIVHQMVIVLDREFIYEERQKIRIDMESEHLKSTLLRSISHDLRTPLTGIKGASELILDSYDNLDAKSVKKLASDIYDESTWLIKTVQNILDMTRFSEGRLTVNKDYEAVDDIVNQTLTHIPHLTSSDRFHVYVPEDIILVPVEGRLIVQVLVNLLDNAYKHAGEDAQIYFKVYSQDDTAIFEISDNGVGIDPLIIDKIFDGFVTLHKNNIVDSNFGVGLGLTICKEIVTAHKGTITVKNSKTGGAVFKVVLPLEVV
ncbi:MAG: DUF4118 domain-containing protein [Sedimentibacter sp.]|uniref:sensor histidine kinase n=1 Tax=Sedimentibacter sp. TaxID=1960295 RepID=UPI002980B0B5|nr:DUF4118 domain-containing protein [Sedimentibacter sp.]MDW5299256.1 DUF4118 domain-containing protein [Sedimentibacter sp.]